MSSSTTGAHPCFGRLRRFRFNRPQRIAALLLLCFLVQGLGRIALSSPDSAPLRLLALTVGCLLGGALWWVTRRMYGNLGGYTALALYCFCPALLQASTHPSPEILAALGLYGGLYTAIGVAHAMQGPRRKWRPRIVLLTAAYTLAALAHAAALPLLFLAGLAFMLWVGEGRRRLILPVVLLAAAGALLFAFLLSGCSLTFLDLSALSPSLSLLPARDFFLSLPEAGIALATLVALLLYALSARSRYFGNTTPLLCALAGFALALPGLSSLWAIPFLLTFIAGLAADAYESARPRLALATGAIFLIGQLFCAALAFIRPR